MFSWFVEITTRLTVFRVGITVVEYAKGFEIFLRLCTSMWRRKAKLEIDDVPRVVCERVLIVTLAWF